MKLISMAVAAMLGVSAVFAATDPRAGQPEGERIALWPEGKIPSFEEHQYNAPFIEWFVPSNKTTDAVMIVTCGGGYGICNWVPGGSLGGGLRDWLLAKGMTVVRLHHRTPRPKKVEKHVTAWQDAQRAVRLVRAGAAAHGVSPVRHVPRVPHARRCRRILVDGEHQGLFAAARDARFVRASRVRVARPRLQVQRRDEGQVPRVASAPLGLARADQPLQ